jgi:hypothetical protein
MLFSRMSSVGAARARNASQSHQHHQHRIPDQLTLIMKIGRLPDAMDSGIHRAWAHWIRGFMASPLGPACTDRDADGAGVT